MSDSEIRSTIDRIVDNLREQLAHYARECGRFEALYDSAWLEIHDLTAQRDRLQADIDRLRRGNPCCQLHHPD